MKTEQNARGERIDHDTSNTERYEPIARPIAMASLRTLTAPSRASGAGTRRRPSRATRCPAKPVRARVTTNGTASDKSISQPSGRSVLPYGPVPICGLHSKSGREGEAE